MGGIKGRKMRKRLARRLKAFQEHGSRPNKNPGKETPPMEMHQPGSNKK